MVGAATFQNTKSTADKLRDREPTCLAPVLKGALEFHELQAVGQGDGGTIRLTAHTNYTDVDTR